MTDIRPQPGPQEAFLSSSADIVIYGGAAGGGKTYGLLMEPLRHIDKPGFGAVIFRRKYNQITSQGGLWDTALKLYPQVQAESLVSPKLMFRWPSGAKVAFDHLNLESSVEDWQGSQIDLIMFDELTHFTQRQFFYMLSRNRSLTGVKPYMRATTNPDADSWVSKFIEWWVDQETGLAITERSGVIRWMVRIDDQICWGDSPQQLSDRHGIPTEDAKSVTFIPAKLEDNAILMRADPGYAANLKALSRVEQARLKDGNWKIRPAAGMYFRRHEVDILPHVPGDIVSVTRAWDLAATEPHEGDTNPDWTAGVKIGRRSSGKFVVLDVVRHQIRAAAVRKLVKTTADADGRECKVKIAQDPGQAGKDQAESYSLALAGYTVETKTVSGDKVTRAEPFSAQWQEGNVEVVKAPWNDAYFSELEAFVSKGVHDDQVDASVDAFEGVLSQASGYASRGRRSFGD